MSKPFEPSLPLPRATLLARKKTRIKLGAYLRTSVHRTGERADTPGGGMRATWTRAMRRLAWWDPHWTVHAERWWYDRHPNEKHPRRGKPLVELSPSRL